MAKVLKTIAVVAIAVAVVVFAPQIAGVLASSFGLATGVALSAGVIAGITSAVVGIGISLGLSAIGTLFRKSASLSDSSAARLSESIVPAAPRKIVFGLTAAGNDVRYFERFGSKKDHYQKIVALASHKCTIKQFYVDNDLTWDSGSLVAHKDGIWSCAAINEGSSANSFAVNGGTYWTKTASFTGCAYWAIDYKIDDKAWPQGIPSKTTIIVEGCPVYDPRLDSTAGGSGSHRANDQSTWEYWHNGVAIGRNPALCLTTYLLGYRIKGKLAWGMGVPASTIALDNIRTYANMCEESVTTTSGTAQRYTCDGIASTADTHETIIGAITAAMGSCKLTDVGGLYSLVGGYDDTLGPIASFTADDLVGGTGSPSPYSWVPAGPTRETYNIATGRFADPSQLYQLVSWGTIETDPLPDGIPRTLTLDLGYVSRSDACQRIAKQFLMREAKTPGFFSATFGPRAFSVQVGSLLKLTLPQEGWNAKLFRVQDQKEVHDMIYSMTLREESADVYAWDKNETLALPPTIRPQGYDASDTISPTGLSLESTTYEGTA